MQRKLSRTFAVILAVALLTALAPVTGTTSAQDDDARRTITVTGIGQASGAPDVAFVELGVELRDTDISAAVEQANSTVETVTAALTEAGVNEEDIQTTQFNVYQEDARDPQTGEIIGEPNYVVTNIIRVRVPGTDQISEVIQTALDAGANRVFGLTFGLDDPDALLSEARTDAIDDARARAEELAATFGVTLGDAVQIVEGTLPNQPPQPFGFDAQGLGGGGPTISPGQLSVILQVTVTFEVTS